MNAEKLMLNPARLRIVQYLRLHDCARTSDIVAYLGDVPRATVYHHMKILEDHGMIEVVEERPVRGATEKVYALVHPAGLAGSDVTVALSTAFHVGLMQEMNDYLSRDDHDCSRDTVFFSTAVLHLDETEYRALVGEIRDVLAPYLDRVPAEGRAQRKLTLISAPPQGGAA